MKMSNFGTKKCEGENIEVLLKAYVLNNDVKSGQEITTDMLKLQERLIWQLFQVILLEALFLHLIIID